MKEELETHLVCSRCGRRAYWLYRRSVGPGIWAHVLRVHGKPEDEVETPKPCPRCGCETFLRADCLEPGEPDRLEKAHLERTKPLDSIDISRGLR